MLIGRTGGTRRVGRAVGRAAGGRYPGRWPLLLGGLALCAAAVALALVRRSGRGGTEPDDAAAPPAVSDPAPPEPSGSAGSQERREGAEERVRARIAQDARTQDLPSLDITVDDGMAWIDGHVPSPAAREALTAVVGGVEGIDIVVNRVAVREF